MSKRLVVFAVCLAAVFIGVYVAFFQEPSENEIASRVQTCDELLQAYQKIGKFNGSVLIAKDGEVLLRKGYGVRNDALGASHDHSSIFRIYSITKPFTSTLVLRLVEEGKLSLDDKLSDYYPGLPNAESISIKHLLTHTSGLFEFTRENDFVNSEAALLELLANRPVDFPPGEGWSYCNSGYCLLGHLIAKVNESTYEEAVTTQIFEPLAMADSGVKFNSLEDPRKSVGYGTFSKTVRTEVTMDDEGGPFAAGAIYSTVDDLCRFQNALNNGRLLRKDLLKAAGRGCEQNAGYGYGWQIGSRGFFQKVISHSGGAAGFRSNLSQIEGGKYCVILLNNHENANVEFLTDRIYDILDGYVVEIPEEGIELSPEQLDDYVGFFEPDDKNGIIRTYVVDGRLAVDFLGRAQGTMLAEGNDRFFQIESQVEVEFRRDSDGKCVGLTAHQDRMTLNARKYEGAWGIPDSKVQSLSDLLDATPPESDQWHEAAFMLAHLLAFQGEYDRYEQLCRRMLEHHSDSKSSQIAERTTKACLLLQEASFVKEVGELADRAYAAKDKSGTFDWGGPVPWRDYLAVAKGMADYRRGNYESVVAVLEPATEFSRHDHHSVCVRDLLLAMSYQQTGQSESARRCFEAATKVIDQLPESYAQGGWNDRILVDLIYRETEDVLSVTGD